MNNIKRIELYSTEHCASCEIALHDIVPVLRKHNIPLIVKKDVTVGITYPMICIVRNDNGVEKKECIEGYDKNLADDIEGML